MESPDRLAVGHTWVWYDALQAPLHRVLVRESLELSRRSLGEEALQLVPGTRSYSDHKRLLLGVDPDRLTLLGFMLLEVPQESVGPVRIEQVVVAETHGRRIGSCLVDLAVPLAEQRHTPLLVCASDDVVDFFQLQEGCRQHGDSLRPLSRLL